MRGVRLLILHQLRLYLILLQSVAVAVVLWAFQLAGVLVQVVLLATVAKVGQRVICLAVIRLALIRLALIRLPEIITIKVVITVIKVVITVIKAVIMRQ